MKKHTEIYFDAFGIDKSDNSVFIPSELDGEKAVDIHHIIGRGKKGEDRIENLMALTREEHEKYGDKKEYMEGLLRFHRARLIFNNIPFDDEWFNKQMQRYENISS